MKMIQFVCCSFQAKKDYSNTNVKYDHYPWAPGIAAFGVPVRGRKKEFLFIIDSDGLAISHYHIQKYKLLRKYGSVSLPTGIKDEERT